MIELNPTSADPAHLPSGGKPCPACGAPHDPEDRFCPACGAELPQAVSQPRSEALAETPAMPGDQAEQKHFRCKNCGAEVATDPDQRSYVCPFCDSTYILEFSRAETERQRPEFVIGFKITPEEALKRFRAWLATNTWFRPGDLRQAKIEEKLRGVYLPFWSFPMLATSRWSVTIGEYWYRTETYRTRVNGKMVTRTRRVRETEWWPLEGRHHRYYTGYLVSGSRGLPQDEAERIQPFFLEALKRYEPYYLAGWYAEEYSVDHGQALARSQQEYHRREQANVAAFLPGDTHRQLSIETHYSQISSDLVLLPVYLLSYRYRDKIYRFLLNGQTGKAAGDKPVSGRRIAVAVLGGLGFILILILIVLIFAGR